MAGSYKDDGTLRKNAAKICVDCAALPYRRWPEDWYTQRQIPTQFRPVNNRKIKSGTNHDNYRCAEHTRFAQLVARVEKK